MAIVLSKFITAFCMASIVIVNQFKCKANPEHITEKDLNH